MSTQELTEQALALPRKEREALVQALWVSIDEEAPLDENPEFMKEVLQRSEELTTGAVKGHTLEEAIKLVRQGLKCS